MDYSVQLRRHRLAQETMAVATVSLEAGGSASRSIVLAAPSSNSPADDLRWTQHGRNDLGLNLNRAGNLDFVTPHARANLTNIPSTSVEGQTSSSDLFVGELCGSKINNYLGHPINATQLISPVFLKAPSEAGAISRCKSDPGNAQQAAW
jgi:hypothetical protein